MDNGPLRRYRVLRGMRGGLRIISAHFDFSVQKPSSCSFQALRHPANTFQSTLTAWKRCTIASSHFRQGLRTFLPPSSGFHTNVSKVHRESVNRATCPTHRHFFRRCAMTQGSIECCRIFTSTNSVARLIQSTQASSSPPVRRRT